MIAERETEKNKKKKKIRYASSFFSDRSIDRLSESDFKYLAVYYCIIVTVIATTTTTTSDISVTIMPTDWQQ